MFWLWGFGPSFFRVIMSALSAPEGATASTPSGASRNIAQAICTKLLKAPLADIAEVVGCDVSGASRVRANERPCTLNVWLRVIDFLGYKLVGKTQLCMPRDEARMLRRAYAFISSSDEMAARFAADLEAVPLDWDEDQA